MHGWFWTDYSILPSCSCCTSFCLLVSVVTYSVWALACRPFRDSILPERNTKINSKLKSSQIVHNLVQWSALVLFKFISWYETIRLQFSFRFHISIWITQIKKSVKIISWYEILAFYTFIFSYLDMTQFYNTNSYLDIIYQKFSIKIIL